MQFNSRSMMTLQSLTFSSAPEPTSMLVRLVDNFLPLQALLA